MSEKKLLVVDDDDLIYEVVELIKKNNVICLRANNGFEAIALCCQMDDIS